MKSLNRYFSKISVLVIFIFFGYSVSVKSQTLIVNDAADTQSTFSPEDLIRNVLIDGSCANVSNISSLVGGAPGDRTTKSYGYFKARPGSRFPFSEGLVLTSGRAFNAANPATPNLSDDSGTGSDADLVNAIPGGGPFFNATVFEFDFVPTSTTISFRYVMASEEYDEAQGFPCSFADSFAFLLRQDGTTAYENIAVLPGITPVTPVSVVNVHDEIPASAGTPGCAAQNETFFEGYNIGDTNYGGRTVVLTATATVVPNATYHIKLVIADAGDNAFDSAVFLEAGSFNLGLELGDDFVSADDTAVCGGSIPLTANITASSYQWSKDGVPIPGATNQTYNANLGNGTYSCDISLSASCTDSDSVVLEFVDAASINPTITNLQECDPDLDLLEVFDLTSKNTEILNGLDPATFDVQFFSDAAYTTLIPNPATYTNGAPAETIYARVVNRNSRNCFADGSFTIEVTGLPVATQPIDYEICDDATDGDDTNGFLNGFLLSTKDAEILGTLDPAQYSVSYHTSLIGAQTSNATDAIDKNNPYTNTVVNTQQIFIRVENVDNVSCNDTSLSFNIIVSPLPTITAAVELKQCDDDTDGFSVFNLNEAATDISTNHLNETFVFYPTLADAQGDTNAISAADALVFTNRTVTTDIVWARAISTFGCYRIS
ncbi:MAG: choice-of-anchor L domain-containing protein, partial [Flavobacteriaceae bacterium]